MLWPHLPQRHVVRFLLALAILVGARVAQAQSGCTYPVWPQDRTPELRAPLIVECRRALAAHPDSLALYKALDHLLLDHPEERIANLTVGLGVAPHDAELWGNLGFAYRQAGRLTDALTAMRRAGTFDPWNANYAQESGLIATDLGQNDLALALFQETLERNPEATEVWGYRARVLRRVGRHREAVEAWDKAERLRPHGFIDEAGDREGYEASKASLN